MSSPNLTTRPYWWWRFVYFAIVAGVILYVLIWAADTKVLAAQVATGIVTAKEHHEMKTTYSMQRIGSVNQVMPKVVPEQFVLILRLEGKDVEWPVEKDFFRSVREGQQLRVRFERRRITGSLRVLSLEK